MQISPFSFSPQYAMTLSVLKLIESIQKLRKFTLNLQPPTLSERKEHLKKLFSIMSRDDRGAWEIEGSIAVGEASVSAAKEAASAYPLGVVAIVSPRILPIRTTLERWIPSYLAGNASLIKMSSKEPGAADKLKNWLDEAGIPSDSFQIVTESREVLGDFLTSHPAIRGFSFVGSHPVGQSLFSKDLWGRRMQMWLGGFTTNLILDSEGLALAMRSLEQQLKEQAWTTPFFPQRWIVLDSIEKQVEENLEQLFSQGPDQIPLLKEFFAQAQQEEGKLRQGWVQHLPLCSVIHQSEVRLPTVTLNSVKYPFDMQKWVNHSNLGFAVQIWGEKEKALKIANKFEVGSISINTPLNPKDSILFGAKQSTFGTVDLSPEGLFFSEHRTVRSLRV